MSGQHGHALIVLCVDVCKCWSGHKVWHIDVRQWEVWQRLSLSCPSIMFTPDKFNRKKGRQGKREMEGEIPDNQGQSLEDEYISPRAACEGRTELRTAHRSKMNFAE